MKAAMHPVGKGGDNKLGRLVSKGDFGADVAGRKKSAMRGMMGKTMTMGKPEMKKTGKMKGHRSGRY